MSLFPKQIATALHLLNPEKYTSHSCKRTSLTWMADSGMSLAQIKSASGHKSDRVVQKYIDNSSVQKRTAATALGVHHSGTATMVNETRRIRTNHSSSSSSSAHQQIMTFNVGTGGVLNVFTNGPPPTSTASVTTTLSTATEGDKVED